MLFDSLACLTWHLGFSGDLPGARRAAQEAEHISESLGPPTVVGLAMMLTDVLLFHARPAREVVEAGRRALTLIDDLGLSSTQCHLVRANVAQALAAAGEVAASADLLRRCDLRSGDYSVWALRGSAAAVAVARGHLDDAFTMLQTPHQADYFAELPWQTLAAEVRLWSGQPAAGLDRLVQLLEDVLPLPHARIAGAALVMAARAAADADLDADRWHARLCRLRRQAAVDPLGPGVVPGHRAASTATWEAELARLRRSATVEDWVTASLAWDDLSRPHDAAYCRWRAAQVAVGEGRATAATKLLRRAARDAREHIPLSAAIRETAGVAGRR
jgi:hypothetical protein